MITDNRPSAPTPDNAAEARQLLRAHRYGSLCTLSKKFDGHPFGSITPYLVDHDGSLLILISSLAEHTKNILADARVSLITHNQDAPHIQTQGRVTLLGNAALVEDRENASRRYLRYFPEAQAYFAMHDFSFYRITPQAIRFIGGFGNIHWVKAENYIVPNYALITEEDALLEELNAKRTAAQGMVIGIDCDGYDVREGDKVSRSQFAEMMLDASQARGAM
jgi:putative heme iron utilization protein